MEKLVEKAIQGCHRLEAHLVEYETNLGSDLRRGYLNRVLRARDHLIVCILAIDERHQAASGETDSLR